jgi:hypothetical protein
MQKYRITFLSPSECAAITSHDKIIQKIVVYMELPPTYCQRILNEIQWT